MTERLMDAVLSLRYQQLEALLRKNVSVNTRNRLGQTPLMVACYVSNEEKSYCMFKFLLKKGADVMESDDKRTSVFQHACKQGREQIARCIIRKMSIVAVDLGGKNLEGRTPLFDAVTSGNESLVRFIVRLMRKRSLTVDTPDHSGVTPLIQAYKMGLVAIAQVLEKDGKANPRISDTERHMNSIEWAEEAATKRLSALALHKERTKEHQMIYPHFDHRKLPPFTSHKSSSLPEIKPRWEWASINTKSDTIGGNSWNNDSQRIADRNYNSSIVEESLQMSSQDPNSSVVGKSLDSTMTLLELSSKTSDKIHFAKNFVSSHFDKSKISEYGNLSTVNSLLKIYSNQCGSTFRQPAKPPPEPEPVLEQHICEKKASTLAYIMGRGPPRVKYRRNYKRSRKRTVKRNYMGLHQQSSRRGASSSSDLAAEKLSGSRVSNIKVNDGSHNRLSQNSKVISDVNVAQDRASLGKLKRNSKSVYDSQKLSRVPENDPGYQQSVAPSLKPRDSLPNIRVTAPSA